MNNEALFLFLILLLGLVLCSFLGGNCGSEGFTGKFSGTFVTDNNWKSGNDRRKDRRHSSSGRGYDNYNHFSGTSSQLPGGTTFYGQNGGYVVANSNSDGSQTLKVVLAGGQQPIMLTTPPPKASSTTESFTNSGDSSTFYGPDGTEAVVQHGANGQPVVQVQTSSGTYSYTSDGDQSNSSSSNTNSMSSSNPDGMSSTQYFGSTGYPIQTSGSSLSYQGPNSSSSNLPYQGPNRGSDVPGASASNYNYSSSLPKGIPASQIPAGQEDMYILKSEIVPPVCPACPSSTACPRQEKCPPCPACARCPEPAFECKKVPNYNAAAGNDSLPTPVLNDFSSFGM